MEREIIQELIEKAGADPDFFTGGADKACIDAIEKELNVVLPESYCWFLETYGHGGIVGVEIFGVAKNNVLTCVKRTLFLRRFNLPSQYVAIENCDEYDYCLDTRKLIDGECPIISWSRTGSVRLESNNFYEFVIMRFKTSLENDGLL